jgi:hypothetical protein
MQKVMQEAVKEEVVLWCPAVAGEGSDDEGEE